MLNKLYLVAVFNCKFLNAFFEHNFGPFFRFLLPRKIADQTVLWVCISIQLPSPTRLVGDKLLTLTLQRQQISNMNSTNKSLDFCDSFAISCGTVTVDLATSKVLLIRTRKTNECYLPKGRKDIDESLHDAAIRETYEETGVHARILPVNIVTRATTAAEPAIHASAQSVAEPIAVSQRVTNGVRKIIFWFVAVADSTMVPNEGTQQADEDFQSVWMAFEDVSSALDFEDDIRVAEAGIVAAVATV